MSRRRSDRNRTLTADDRAVSIAITHVLAIGITTLLISGLLIGASGLLGQQRDDAAREELNTIGNRLATQIETAESLVEGDGTPLGGGGDAENVTFVVDQPARISGGSYTVDLNKTGDRCDAEDLPPDDDADMCLVLDASNSDLNVRPVKIPLRFDDSGDVTVSLTNRGGGEFVIVVADP